jgi:hypothetical protein
VFDRAVIMSAQTLDHAIDVTVSLEEGAADGTRVTTFREWTGSWLDFPRDSFQLIRGRKELARTGVYLLVSTSDIVGEPTKIYVGETQSLATRLGQHLGSKDFWQRAYVLTSKVEEESLNKAHVGFLEARLIEIAKKGLRVEIINTQKPDAGGLSPAEARFVEGFLQKALSVLPLLGVTAFVSIKPASGILGLAEDPHFSDDEDGVNAGSIHFYLKREHTRGEAIYEKSGFTVLAGSLARRDPVQMAPTYSRLRQQLIDSGVLEVANEAELSMSRPYTFNSPSAAAAVLIGGAVNGRGAWQTVGGQNFADWEAQQTR